MSTKPLHELTDAEAIEAGLINVERVKSPAIRLADVDRLLVDLDAGPPVPIPLYPPSTPSAADDPEAVADAILAALERLEAAYRRLRAKQDEERIAGELFAAMLTEAVSRVTTRVTMAEARLTAIEAAALMGRL